MQDFATLQTLLGQSGDAEDVLQIRQGRKIDYRRAAGSGYITWPEEGVDLVFDETSGLLEDVITPEFMLSCVHLYADGKSGYTQYAGILPMGLVFGETMRDVERRLGTPVRRGGGEFSSLLGGIIPLWFDYLHEGLVLHLQFSPGKKLEMISLMLTSPGEEAGNTSLREPTSIHMESSPPPVPSSLPPHVQATSRRSGAVFRWLAHACWLSFFIALAILVVMFLNRTPQQVMMIGFLVVVLILLAGALAGIVALCGIKAHGRKGILWPAVVGLSLRLLLLAVMLFSQLVG